MKKKFFIIIMVILILITLNGCGTNKTSTSYSDLVGSWQLDSRYVDGSSKTVKWMILDFKSDKTVDIYEYTQQDTISKEINKKETVPDKSQFTLMATSPVEVSGESISYQYNGNAITAKFFVDLSSYTMNFYIENSTNNIIHEIYKTADKSKRP